MSDFAGRCRNWGARIGQAKPKLTPEIEEILKYELDLANKVLEFKGSKHWQVLIHVLELRQKQAIAQLSNSAVKEEQAMRLKYVLEDVQDIYTIFDDMVKRGKSAQSQLEKFKEKE